MTNFDSFIGTKEVQGKHLFDVVALEAYLLQHLPGFAGPLTAEMFKGGQSNPTYKLNTPTHSYVMRAKPGPVVKLLHHGVHARPRAVGPIAAGYDAT